MNVAGSSERRAPIHSSFSMFLSQVFTLRERTERMLLPLEYFKGNSRRIYVRVCYEILFAFTCHKNNKASLLFIFICGDIGSRGCKNLS